MVRERSRAPPPAVTEEAGQTMPADLNTVGLVGH